MKKKLLTFLLAVALVVLSAPIFGSQVVQEVHAGDMVFSEVYTIEDEDLEIVPGKTAKAVGTLKWKYKTVSAEEEAYIMSKSKNVSYWYDETSEKKATVFEANHKYSYVTSVEIEDYDEVVKHTMTYASHGIAWEPMVSGVNKYTIDCSMYEKNDVSGTKSKLITVGKLYMFDYVFDTWTSSGYIFNPMRGMLYQLPKVIVCPQGTSNTNVTWTCDNPNTVISSSSAYCNYQTNEIQGIQTLTYTASNGMSKQIKAYVGYGIESKYTINTTELTIATSTNSGEGSANWVGNNCYMPEIETISGTDKEFQYCRWENILSVTKDDSDGSLKTVYLGACSSSEAEKIINVEASDETSRVVYDSCTVKYVNAEKAINASPLAATMRQGTTIHLTITDGASASDYTWSSSDSSLVSVDANGAVKALKYVKDKTVTITGTKADGTTVTSNIKVEIPVESVSVSKSSVTLKVGESTQLDYTVAPSNNTLGLPVYFTRDKNVTVDPTGKITANAIGQASVSVYADGKVATCVVTVSNDVVTPTPNPTATPKPTPTPSEQGNMNRLYNPNSGEHFYTTNNDESNYLATLGWQYEGKGWDAPETGNPVYRMYNPNAGDHHYTLNAAEKDMLVTLGWDFEGIGWYSDVNETTPLYREYNPNESTGNHNYTTNKAEHDMLVNMGWHDEGIAWYGK